MKQTVLLIDAGHGGIDPQGKYTTFPSKCTKHPAEFAYHNKGWFYEGVSNRHLASEFIAQASRRGFVCIPVYHPYKDVHINNRAILANDIADALKCNSVYLSFHSNSISANHDPQNRAEGLTVFTYGNRGTAYNIGKQTGEAMRAIYEEYGSKRSSLMHQANFTVLSKTIMPAILYEFGFFDNPKDADLLFNYEFTTEIINTLVYQLTKILD